MSRRGTSTDRSRSLWRLVLAATLLIVIADFADYPTVSGLRASPPVTDLTLVLTAGDAGSPLKKDADVFAGALSELPRSAQARSSGVGTAATILEFAEHQDPGELLLLTSTAVAELTRGAQQPTSDDEARASRSALAALRRLQPIAPLFRDPVAVLVRDGPGPADFAELIDQVVERPGGRVLGLPADAAAKASIAGLIAGLGIDGEVPYRSFPNSSQAAMALAGGTVDVAITPRSQALGELKRGKIHTLAMPPGKAGEAHWLDPTWAILVGAPALREHQRQALRKVAARAQRSRSWRLHLGRQRLQPLEVGAEGLRRFVSRRAARAARLAEIVAAVSERPAGERVG
jgi:tripartite-type tricarboxylate transporter receptor subunit TctC